MIDLEKHMRRLDQIPAPDLWPSVQSSCSSPSRRRPAIPLVVGGGVLAVVLAVVMFAVTVDRSGDDRQQVQVGEGQAPPATSGPSAPRVVSTIPGQRMLRSVTAGFGSLWVGAGRGGLDRIDPSANRVIASLELEPGPHGLAVGEGAVWAVGGGDGAAPQAFLWRIDPVANVVTGRLALDGAYQVAAGGGAVWVTNARDRLWRIDPTRLQVQAAIAIDRPIGVATTADAVWVTRPDAGTVDRVNPSTNAVTASIPVGRFPNAIAVGPNTVWVSNFGDGTVSGIDPATNAVRSTIRVGGSPAGLADDGAGNLWVIAAQTPPSVATSASRTSVVRVEVATGEQSPALEIGLTRGVTVLGQALWVVDLTQDSLLRIE